MRYIVPDRVVDGYGLTAPIAQRVHQAGADLLITVDNGIASMEGVAQAQALGLQVLVTDHHLPALLDGQPTLPDAHALVNPNRQDQSSGLKHLAAVGVAFVLLVAVFVLSSFLDNIAAAMIGGAVAHTVFRGKVQAGEGYH